jgi:oligoribonuclease
MKTLFWVDLEMTGLDENVDTILEVAIAITDLDFTILEEYQQVVYQPEEVLEKMNDWCKKHHGQSGLTAAVKTGKPLNVVESEVIAIINKYFKEKERVIITGNSISNDKRFIDKYMLNLAKRLHYRIIDVSSFKEIFREKFGIDFEKKKTHRAIEDVRESIAELKAYLAMVTPPPPKSS